MTARSLINLLLVLVIAFAMPQQVRTVAAVQPQAGGSQGNSYQLVLAVAADGTMTLNGHAVPEAELERTLTAIYRDRASKVLFIKVASERPEQEVRRIIDRAKAAGVRIVAMVPRQG
ncbi:MAG: biopolymer transporter ExbD [Gemmatimonadales bacterium]|nr:biopolymer transporter ExbD [Gemmatimonadales bacterium]